MDWLFVDDNWFIGNVLNWLLVDNVVDWFFVEVMVHVVLVEVMVHVVVHVVVVEVMAHVVFNNLVRFVVDSDSFVSSSPGWAAWESDSVVSVLVILSEFLVFMGEMLIFLMGTGVSHLSNHLIALFFEVSFTEGFSVNSRLNELLGAVATLREADDSVIDKSLLDSVRMGDFVKDVVHHVAVAVSRGNGSSLSSGVMNHSVLMDVLVMMVSGFFVNVVVES